MVCCIHESFSEHIDILTEKEERTESKGKNYFLFALCPSLSVLYYGAGISYTYQFFAVAIDVVPAVTTSS